MRKTWEEALILGSLMVVGLGWWVVGVAESECLGIQLGTELTGLIVGLESGGKGEQGVKDQKEAEKVDEISFTENKKIEEGQMGERYWNPGKKQGSSSL